MQNVKSQIYYLTQTVLQLRGALKNTDVAVSSSSTTNDVPSLPSPVLTTTTSTGNNTFRISACFFYAAIGSSRANFCSFRHFKKIKLKSLDCYDVPSLPSPVLTTTTSTGNNTFGAFFLYFDFNSKEQTISGFK